MKNNELLEQLTCSKKNKDLATNKDRIPFTYAYAAFKFRTLLLK